MPRWVISSPIHIRSVQPAVSVITIRNSFVAVSFADHAGPCGVLEALEEEDVAQRLAERERDGEVAGVLRDLLLADLALLLQALEGWHDHRQELQDDRSRDVGHDPQREQGQAREAAAREEVQEAEDVVRGEVVLDVLDGRRVDAGRRDVGTEPVERQDRRGEQQLLADVLDAEGVEDRLKHQSRTSAVPPAPSIFSFALALKAWARTVSLVLISPVPRTLTGWLRLASPASREGLGGHLVTRLEAVIEVADVDRLGPGAELLEGHRHLVVRAAQLPHPHVDRGLAALVGDLALGSGAGAGSLVPAARRLAEPAALASAQALARCARAGRRAQVVSPSRLVVGSLRLTSDLDQVRGTARI